MKQEFKALSRGIRKYIRIEKSRIRRAVADVNGRQELIRELYKSVGVENYPLQTKKLKS
jgi:hypothetical protein